MDLEKLEKVAFVWLMLNTNALLSVFVAILIAKFFFGSI